MNQDDAGCPLARRLFILVGPAAVVGERLARKEFWIVGGWLVHQHEQHLALHVHILVVVPVELWRIDAVTHPDKVGAQVVASVAGFVSRNEVLAIDQVKRRATIRDEAQR